ncbi:alpha-galacturonidase [Ruminiclostridium hungatei]|uniref:Alpha-galacturonidase n=1 Tax=Ruminiclostridium hungatei TaxID=48256 RepID=A0A1V4SPB4_RUMHU|nr:alpha-glucosidase/alpha-galactosidase [Ruminiclostridium hungatei]OPX45684.1 alpha-galacturonidase [Ruminiclostridium hungatei]
MLYDKNNLNIAYIGGGSRGWAWNLMKDLAVDEEISGTVRLYDINQEAARANEKIGNMLSERPDVSGKWQYKAMDSLKEALTGTDFVIISILPGSFEEMASDVHLPEEYGIYQSVGDTVGPGGLVRALRTIPMFVEIAEAIKAYSPEAWVINYTNPMTLCTKTLYQVFPGIKAFGCCHEVFSTQKIMAEMLKDMKGIAGIDREDIKVNVIGINHFTWLNSATYKGEDLLPLYREFTEKYAEEGYQIETEADQVRNSYFNSYNKVKFDLFRRYGLVAAAGDRHLAEFCPPWYLKNPEVAKEWGFGLTPVSWRVKDLKDKMEKSSRFLSGEEQMELKHSGEEGIKQIKALVGLGDLVTNVNLPNMGQIQGLPLGAVVETNAVFSHNSIRPVSAGQLPEEIYSLVIRHVVNQETIIRAAFSKDKDLAFKAFANDPLVNISIKDARNLFERMLSNTSEYLPGWEIEK